MEILLSWQLVVASVLFLTGFASLQLELSDSLADPGSSVARDDKPVPTKISSMHFESVCINIYDSQLNFNRKIYYYSPIARLNPVNVVSTLDETRGALKVGFIIWNPNVTIQVAQHLNQFLNQKVETNQVLVFPFNSLRMTSKVQSAGFSLTNEWVPFKNQPQLQLKLTCPTKADCDGVKAQIKNNEFENVLGLELDPPLNDGNCKNDEKSSQENSTSSIEVKELAKSLEETKMNFANELAKAKQELRTNFEAFREEIKKEFSSTSQMLPVDKTYVTEENLAMVQKELDSTRIELINTKSIVDDLRTKLNARTSDIVDIGQMPTNCDDLHRMGQKLGGFFSVKGSEKMEMVYCDFFPNQNDMQKWIGYVDVKSASVHFYVQRNSNFITIGTPIPFDLALVNKGNAMNLATGIFTAPGPGTYFFSFTGLAELEASSSSIFFGIDLYINGDLIGTSYVYESNNVASQWSPLTLQSTLNLKKGDQLWVRIGAATTSGAHLYDDIYHKTHFTGFLLEEQIVGTI